jgi:hypothetical protein
VTEYLFTSLAIETTVGVDELRPLTHTREFEEESIAKTESPPRGSAFREVKPGGELGMRRREPFSVEKARPFAV